MSQIEQLLECERKDGNALLDVESLLEAAKEICKRHKQGAADRKLSEFKWQGIPRLQ